MGALAHCWQRHTACITAPPAKSKLTTGGPKNFRWGLTPGFWALPSTCAKQVFWFEHSFYEKQWQQRKRKEKEKIGENSCPLNKLLPVDCLNSDWLQRKCSCQNMQKLLIFYSNTFLRRHLFNKSKNNNKRVWYSYALFFSEVKSMYVVVNSCLQLPGQPLHCIISRYLGFAKI